MSNCQSINGKKGKEEEEWNGVEGWWRGEEGREGETSSLLLRQENLKSPNPAKGPNTLFLQQFTLKLNRN